MPGAIIIGGAASMLFIRIVHALLRHRQVQAALRQHHAQPPPTKPFQTLIESVPLRLRIGLALGATSTLAGLMPAALRALVPWADSDSAVARALWLSAKWLVLATVLQKLRSYALQRMRFGRAGTAG